MNNWRVLLSIPVAFLLATVVLLSWKLPESNKYLLTVGNIEEVCNNFNRMAEENNKSLSVRHVQHRDEDEEGRARASQQNSAVAAGSLPDGAMAGCI